MPKVQVEVRGWLAERLSASPGTLIVPEELPAGATVRDVLISLASKYRGAKELLFDDEMQMLGSLVTVIYNDRYAELVNGLDTRVSDGDRIMIVPAFTGG